MGHANVYIRVENEEFWKGLTSPSVWLNEQMALAQTIKADVPVPMTDPVNVITPESVMSNIERILDKPGPKCKIHGIPLTTQGKCLQKGCKYA